MQRSSLAAGDEVTLALRAAEGAAEIRVRDTGVGIAPAFLPKIFDAFVQGAPAPARSDGGLGLGLALVKGIAELHGGTVRVMSAGEGSGAEFIVRLPLAAPKADESSPRARLERSAIRRRVLVVDDNVDGANTLAEIVTMLGHAADVAYDGPTALEKARAAPPDVVICDISLPGMNGYEVARALRAQSTNVARFVALSGLAQAADVRRSIEAGFDEHLAKPCDPHDIERLLA